MIRYSLKPTRPQADIDSTPFHYYEFDDGTIWTEFYRLTDSYVLRFPDLADFEVSSSGDAVIAHPAEGGDDVTVEHLYINQVVPLALSRQGLPAFHASVVTVSSGAVAFLGNSGMGKSTLAASFALEGAAFLTDDSLLIEETNGGCSALPSHASLRLWEDSVEALIDDDNPMAATISYSTKARLLAGDALRHTNESQPLLAAYLLEGEEKPGVTIRPLTGQDRQMAWLSNSFLLDIEDRELLAQHFDWTHRISAVVPTFALDYPRNYGMLPEVRETVRKHIEEQLS